MSPTTVTPFDRPSEGRRARERGAKLEREVAQWLRDRAYVVASMRTAKGGGDLMAAIAGPEAYTGGDADLWLGSLVLVEVKGTLTPFATFGPTDRAQMLIVAEAAGAKAWLAWRKKGARGITWIPSREWPS